MKLTGYLGKDLEDLGLYLEDDGTFLYLKHGGEVIARFNAAAVTLATIRCIAQGWAEKHAEKQI